MRLARISEVIGLQVYLLLLALGDSPLPAAQGAHRFTPPPGQETPAIQSLIDSARTALAAGRTSTDLLADPTFVMAHEWPRFGQLIREHPAPTKLTLVTPQEPGQRLTINGIALDASGKPLAEALVYLYHTSARGWYSDRAAHVMAPDGDRKHARLFGYLRAAADGTFEIHTIRPAGYPDSNLPAHIHIEIQRPRQGTWWVSEIQFDDDPRLTPAAREQSRLERFVICPVEGGADGAWYLKAKFRLP